MNLALHCDEYLLTMAQSFWRHGQDEDRVFELAVRRLPPHRAHLVAAGLETAVEYLTDPVLDPAAAVATDHCVRSTAPDAVASGFDTEVVEEAVRAVDLAAGDGDRALDELRRAGVRVTSRAPVGGRR